LTGLDPRTWLREARRAMARLPSLRMGRAPDGPALPVRDPWPGDPGRGARLLRGELDYAGASRPLRSGFWGDTSGSPIMRSLAHGFPWLRDLRALGTDAARLRARHLVNDWMAASQLEPLAFRPDVVGARITAWLSHYDFFAASADDQFRQRMMSRLVADARGLAAAMPAEQLDARALTALKGLIAASVAMPEHAAFLTRALRFLPQELGRQVLPDGSHAERCRTWWRCARCCNPHRRSRRRRSPHRSSAWRSHCACCAMAITASHCSTAAVRKPTHWWIWC
jgi:uncharacterized heparinase superfamily protein